MWKRLHLAFHCRCDSQATRDREAEARRIWPKMPRNGSDFRSILLPPMSKQHKIESLPCQSTCSGPDFSVPNLRHAFRSARGFGSTHHKIGTSLVCSTGANGALTDLSPSRNRHLLRKEAQRLKSLILRRQDPSQSRAFFLRLRAPGS